MLQIYCPWCGWRNETEFTYGGEAYIVRPHDPFQLSDEAWADYLFFRSNPRGVHYEQWYSHGARRWFYVKRHTVTDQILAVYRVGDQRPVVEFAPKIQDEQVAKASSVSDQPEYKLAEHDPQPSGGKGRRRKGATKGQSA